MKKLLCAAAVVFTLLVITGCGKSGDNGNIPELPRNYNSNVTIEKNAVSCKAVLSSSNGQFKLAYTQPQALEGLVVSQSESGLEVKLNNLSFDGGKWISEKSTAAVIMNVLKLTKDSSAYSLSKQGGCYVYSGNYDGRPFELKRDVKTFYPVSIIYDGGNIKVNFDDFSEN